MLLDACAFARSLPVWRKMGMRSQSAIGLQNRPQTMLSRHRLWQDSFARGGSALASFYAHSCHLRLHVEGLRHLSGSRRTLATPVCLSRRGSARVHELARTFTSQADAWINLFPALEGYQGDGGQEMECDEGYSLEIGLIIANTARVLEKVGYCNSWGQVVINRVLVPKLQSNIETGYTQKMSDLLAGLVAKTSLWQRLTSKNDVFFPLTHTVESTSQEFENIVTIAKHVAPKEQFEVVEALVAVFKPSAEVAIRAEFMMDSLRSKRSTSSNSGSRHFRSNSSRSSVCEDDVERLGSCEGEASCGNRSSSRHPRGICD